MPFHLTDTLVKIVLNDLKSKRVAPALMGEPAIGKTEFVNSLTEHGLAVFSIDVNTLSDKGDLTGVRTVPTPDGKSWQQIFFPHATIVEANDHALANPSQLVVILLDEINRTDSDVTSAALTLTTARRCGHMPFAENIRFVISGNIKGNVTNLDSASLTRFAIYEVEPDAQTFLQIHDGELNPWIKSLLEQHPAYIFQRPINRAAAEASEDEESSFDPSMLADEQEMAQYSAPRTIKGLSDWLNETDAGMLQSLLVTEAVHPKTGMPTNELSLVLQAHTGDTLFTNDLAEMISNSLVSTTTNAAVGTVVSKPTVWNAVIAAADRDSIERIVAGLDIPAREELFLYAVSVPVTAKNRTVVEQVVQVLVSSQMLTKLETPAFRTLINLGTEQKITKTALDKIAQSSDALSTSLSGVMSILTPED